MVMLMDPKEVMGSWEKGEKGDGGEWMSCLISLLPTRMMSGCVLIK